MSDNDETSSIESSVDSYNHENRTMDFIATIRDLMDCDSGHFVCGGAVPIQNSERQQSKDTKQIDPNEEVEQYPPITIHWGLAGSIEEIVLPSETSSNADQGTQLAKLVDNMQPARFGLNGKNVMDESYRKARMLDPSKFLSSFEPYSPGIINTIAQILLPVTPEDDDFHGIRADLYRLNMYIGPSGYFKPHVDTPRSEDQFASLVVCLPSIFTGGQLVVRHSNQEIIFDWAPSSNESIQWAAFYSDVEHEILPVTSGHRITLTYNLCIVPGPSDLAGNSPILDAYQLPLFAAFKDALEDPTFFPQGGIIGRYCSHAYSHSTVPGAHTLPSILKGIDMTFFTILRTLDLEPKVRAILEPFPEDDEDCFYYFDQNTSDVESAGERTFVKRYFNTQMTDRGGDEGVTLQEIYEDCKGEWKRVIWLNDWSTRNEDGEIGIAHLRYGNQATVEFIYSRCALLIEIPSSKMRSIVKENLNQGGIQGINAANQLLIQNQGGLSPKTPCLTPPQNLPNKPADRLTKPPAHRSLRDNADHGKIQVGTSRRHRVGQPSFTVQAQITTSGALKLSLCGCDLDGNIIGTGDVPKGWTIKWPDFIPVEPFVEDHNSSDKVSFKQKVARYLKD